MTDFPHWREFDRGWYLQSDCESDHTAAQQEQEQFSRNTNRVERPGCSPGHFANKGTEGRIAGIHASSDGFLDVDPLELIVIER